MHLLSCTNCAFNGLQLDSIGMSVGYCAEHRRVLSIPTELTCGRHFRKDLSLESANREQQVHAQRFSVNGVFRLSRERRPASMNEASNAAGDIAMLRRDPIGSEVADYGAQETKIVSLARLSSLPGARAEIALTSLGRVYVRRCVDRGGTWTSGLHIFWWIRKRLLEEPQIDVSDLRYTSPIGLKRQVDLARWSVVILRLTFLSDVGAYADATARGKRSRIQSLRGLAERAADETGELSLTKLMRWLKRTGIKSVERALPQAEYDRLAAELHVTT
jgi:hypothetical protein